MTERDKAFAATPLGKAYFRMISVLGSAWVTDQNPNASDRRMDEAWKKATEAQAEFRRLLYELIDGEKVDGNEPGA